MAMAWGKYIPKIYSEIEYSLLHAHKMLKPKFVKNFTQKSNATKALGRNISVKFVE